MVAMFNLRHGWILALFFLCGCTPMVVAGGGAAGYKVATDARSVSRQLDDSTITAKVKSRLIGDESVRAVDIDVDTLDGVVYLTGLVDSDAQKKRAEEIARTTPGVVDVRNRLGVGSRTPGEYLDDKILAGKVKKALIDAPGVHSMAIDVDVTRRVVNLTGAVGSLAEKERALAVAAGVDGVRDVVDNLVVRP